MRSDRFIPIENPIEAAIREYEKREQYSPASNIQTTEDNKLAVTIAVPVLYRTQKETTHWLFDSDNSFATLHHQQRLTTALADDSLKISVEKQHKSATLVRGYNDLAVQNVNITINFDINYNTEEAITKLELAASIPYDENMPPQSKIPRKNILGTTKRYWGNIHATVHIDEPALPFPVASILNIFISPVGLFANGIYCCNRGVPPSCGSFCTDSITEDPIASPQNNDKKWVLRGSLSSSFFQTRVKISGGGTLTPDEQEDLVTTSRGQGGSYSRADLPSRFGIKE